MFFRDEQYQLNASQNPIGSREKTLKVTTTVLYKLYQQMVKVFWVRFYEKHQGLSTCLFSVFVHIFSVKRAYLQQTQFNLIKSVRLPNSVPFLALSHSLILTLLFLTDYYSPWAKSQKRPRNWVS